jgi:hypothetical protein
MRHYERDKCMCISVELLVPAVAGGQQLEAIFDHACTPAIDL